MPSVTYPHLIGVYGRPASSRDGEVKYSGWVSRKNFRRFLIVMRAFELGEREGRSESCIGNDGVSSGS